jgi:hypothetical protein
VGFYRGGQSLGVPATPKRRPTPNPISDFDTYADAHSDPDGYTNSSGYLYADGDGNSNCNTKSYRYKPGSVTWIAFNTAAV